MAGYYNYSMSNNAVDAYQNGEKPLSKWTKAAILSRIVEVIEDYDIEIHFDMEQLKKLKLADLKSLVLCKSSWHHTSCKFNRTDFYDVDADVLEELNNSIIFELFNKKTKKADDIVEIWECNFLEWSKGWGGYKAKKYTEIGEIRGNWFIRPNNRGKKKITANGFEKIRKIEK